jgi:hypothetical protein
METAMMGKVAPPILARMVSASTIQICKPIQLIAEHAVKTAMTALVAPKTFALRAHVTILMTVLQVRTAMPNWAV